MRVRDLPRFAIATPCYESVKPCYMASYAATARYFAADGVMPPQILTVDHCYTPYARALCVEEAIGRVYDPIDGLLWIDADMSWEPQDIERILTVRPEAIVGAFYPGRKDDYLVGSPTEQMPGFDGRLWKAGYVGFGFTWTPMRCFDDARRPWFDTGWEDIMDRIGGTGQDKQFVGEDVWFCKEQAALGETVYGLYGTTVRHTHEPGPRVLTPQLTKQMAATVRFI